MNIVMGRREPVRPAIGKKFERRVYGDSLVGGPGNVAAISRHQQSRNGDECIAR